MSGRHAHLGEAVGAGLEDDEQHADGHGDLLQLQVVGHAGAADGATHAVLGRHGDLAQADGQAVQLGRGQTQPLQQGRAEPTCRGVRTWIKVK